MEIRTERPPDGDPQRRAELVAAESKRATGRAGQGLVKKLWRIPGTRQNVGPWKAPDATGLQQALSLRPYLSLAQCRGEAVGRAPQ